MERRYIVMANGLKMKERKTLTFALKDKETLEKQGYKLVSIAEKLETEN